jgi:hypothetical protein
MPGSGILGFGADFMLGMMRFDGGVSERFLEVSMGSSDGRRRDRHVHVKGSWVACQFSTLRRCGFENRAFCHSLARLVFSFQA